MNTDYLLREPSHGELRAVFGSLTNAAAVTGGDIPTLCFLIANPERIVPRDWRDAPCVPSTAYSKTLWAAVEREYITTAFTSQGDKPTIAETCRRTGYGKDLVRRILTQAGLWPRANA